MSRHFKGTFLLQYVVIVIGQVAVWSKKAKKEKKD